MHPTRPTSPSMNTPPPFNPSGDSTAKLTSVSKHSDNTKHSGAISKVQNTDETQETGPMQGAYAFPSDQDTPEGDRTNLLLQAIRKDKTTDDLKSQDKTASSTVDLLDPEEREKYTVSLFLASKFGYERPAQFLLENNVDVNSRAPDGSTPLHHAAQNRQLNMLHLLTEHGADVNAIDKQSLSPLHMAAQEGHGDMAKILVEKGADVNARDKKQKTALHMAAEAGHSTTVQALVENEADVNARDEIDMSPLHFAAKKGDVGTVKTLLEHGADPNAKAKKNWFSHPTPLYLAKKKGHVEVSKILKSSKKHSASEPREKDLKVKRAETLDSSRMNLLDEDDS